MKRRRSQRTARPPQNNIQPNFLCDILPPEVRVCYLYPFLVDFKSVNSLARSCKELCKEMMHDKGSPFFFPDHWWRAREFLSNNVPSFPHAQRERARMILREFMDHKTECKVFDGLDDEEILEIRFFFDDDYSDDHTIKFALFVGPLERTFMPTDLCAFVYHFPFLLDERPRLPVPPALCNITCAPILPSRETVDALKAEARASHAAKLEQQKREARIPQTLRDEQRELVRSRSDAMATVNSMSYEGTSFRHNGRPSLGDIDRVIIAYQQGAEAAKRLRVIEERLADIAREMEIFRSSD